LHWHCDAWVEAVCRVMLLAGHAVQVALSVVLLNELSAHAVQSLLSWPVNPGRHTQPNALEGIHTALAPHWGQPTHDVSPEPKKPALHTHAWTEALPALAVFELAVQSVHEPGPVLLL
jgi:hypothetical protein